MSVLYIFDAIPNKTSMDCMKDQKKLAPGRIAQLVGRLTQEPEVPGSIPGLPHTFFPPSADSKRAVVNVWQKYVREVLVNG